MAFAVAAQAGDTKTSQDKSKDKDKPACCASKCKASEQAKEGGCPFSKGACTKQASAKQPALKSPKAAESSK